MKRFSIGTGVLIAVVALVVLWSMGVERPGGDRSVAKSRDIGTTVAALAFVATPGVENRTKAPDHDRVVKVRRLIEAANVPMNFWGKVIDQDGSPLAGVAVAYAYSIDHGNDQGVAWIQEEIRKGEVASGADGSFAILGLKGHDLTVESLTKAGYVYKSRLNHSYNFYGDAPLGKFVADQGKPIMFAMIHRDRLELLVHSRGGLRVRADGTPERWNLWEGEPDPKGEFAVTLTREPAVLERPGQPAVWSAEIQIIGGGIIEAPLDADVRRAPESGYLQTVAYPQTEQKPGRPYQSFYVKTGDGKFGRIQVDLDARGEGATARCSITSDMNPRPGSRNLEPPEEE